ncbi:DUF5590 domain-containing protein [Bacillus sp. B1-b2]|uniref:cell wall elongation regulator TseB-like domain-containing protein n=1 Tax=Bacillus sp. B1-b2 TaxID=2653201 RepID=UPI0012622498|nr:DUF5590 domain-containing protein [Bacillus sp. B1-b2]KAB7672956.1 peptidase [Bacillus sp. B1-b2]
MKKWIWIGSLFVVMIIFFCVHTYVQAMKPYNTAKEEAVAIATDKADLESVSKFSIYNGKKTYYIVEGENTKNQSIVVWIEEKSKKITTKQTKNGITKEEAINILLSEQSPEEVNSVRLGMYDDLPVWEIYSYTNNDSINYHYIDFQTGEILLTIENY